MQRNGVKMKVRYDGSKNIYKIIENMTDGKEYEAIVHKDKYILVDDIGNPRVLHRSFFYNNLQIEKVKDGYILFRPNQFQDFHTHLKSYRMAKQIKYNAEHNQMPKTRNIRLLYSHIRVSDNKNYIDKIQQLIDTKKQKGKKLPYRNAEQLR
jgi:hypothetical protein